MIDHTIYQNKNVKVSPAPRINLCPTQFDYFRDLEIKDSFKFLCEVV